MLGLAFAGLLAVAPPPPPPPPPPRAKAVERPLLVGDYAEPDAVALVFSETWQPAWRTMTIALAAEVPVVMFREEIADPGVMRAALDRLPARVLDVVHVLDVAVDTPWVRDWGPLQARTADDALTWLDAPYSTGRTADDLAPQLLGERYGVDVQGIPASIDGGAIASNGKGLCVMTLEYRDAFGGGPGLDPQALGCKVLALAPALADEPTMHADMFVQFVAADVVVLAEVDPARDAANATRLDAAREAIETAAADLGQTIRIERLPMAPPDRRGVYRPYVNFLQAGGVVLVPSYRRVDRKLQAQAHAILRRLMPDARHVVVPSESIAASGGSVHCVTLGLQLSPRGLEATWPTSN